MNTHIELGHVVLAARMCQYNSRVFHALVNCVRAHARQVCRRQQSTTSCPRHHTSRLEGERKTARKRALHPCEEESKRERHTACSKSMQDCDTVQQSGTTAKGWPAEHQVKRRGDCGTGGRGYRFPCSMELLFMYLVAGSCACDMKGLQLLWPLWWNLSTYSCTTRNRCGSLARQ